MQPFFVAYCSVAFVLGVILNLALCLHRDELYPFGGDQGDNLLEVGDDLSSPEIHLEIPVVFYDKSLTSIFVNLNGLITFDRDIYPYRSDFIIPFRYRYIAPFYADVDTTASGNVYYRETQDPSFLEKATNEIARAFPRYSSFRPSSLFIVTWDNVGYYNSQSQKANTFQVIIASDGVHSFVTLNYPEEGVDWYVGEDKDGIAGIPAQVGFDSAEDNIYYLLPGSGTAAVKELERQSNVPGGQAGVWMFKVGNTDGKNIEIPSDDSHAGVDHVPISPSFKSCVDEARYTCHQHATCRDYYQGYCCHCDPPYIGNGIDCTLTNHTLRMSGILTGVLNGERIEMSVHSFLVLFDGRTFTTINPVTPQWARIMFKLPAVGTIFGFLFAFPASPRAKNGFHLTGSRFNRTAEVQFSGSRDVITIRQEFTSADEKFYVRTEIDGIIPPTPVKDGDRIDVQTPRHEYRRVAPGILKARSQQFFSGNDISLFATVDDTISFHECSANPLNDLESLPLVISKGAATYAANSLAIRFSQSNNIGVGRVVEDPCDSAVCDTNAMCQASGENYQCTCKSGFYGSGKECYDVDECREDIHDCHRDGECVNLLGSFTCQCRSGFLGDGKQCQEEPREANSCRELGNCDPNADCVFKNLEMRYQCECRRGFRGNGYQCVYEGYEDESDCSRYPSTCHRDANCAFDYNSRKYECKCNDGFQGDGRNCQTIDCSQNPRMCNQNARCERRGDEYVCVCNPGFYGDGTYSCSLAATGEGGEDGLIYAQGMFIAHAPLGHHGHETSRLISYVSGQLAVAVDVDCSTQSVLWTDVTSKSIQTSSLNGGNAHTIIQNLGSPEGVAVDWIAGNLYWTDSGFDKIQVSKLDGSHIKTLFSKNLTNPRSIVVDPIRGLLFWSDWNREFPKIERSNLDGTDRKVLVSQDLGLPNGLALDYESQFVCWVDAGQRKVECMTYDGRSRRLVHEDAGYVFGLAYFNNVFYWTDWEYNNGIKNKIKQHEHLNNDIPIPHGTSGKLYGIAVAKSACPHGSNPCSYRNGSCRYLCFASLNGGRTCACPDHVSPEECERTAYAQ